MTTRMNFGSGSVQPDGWVNVDKNVDWDHMENWHRWSDEPPEAGLYWMDIVEGPNPVEPEIYPGGFPETWTERFDYIVANHSLSDLTHHELPAALAELHRVLKPGGVLRVLVPDLLEAVEAYWRHEESWFPQDERTGDIDAKLCTFIGWFGTARSNFTEGYLYDLLKGAGFQRVWVIGRGGSLCDDPEIASLDGDRTTALIMEGRK